MGDETARLRDEIDRTRADLTRDVDLITDRTSPSRVVRRRWDRIREAGVSLKERVMGSETGTRYGEYRGYGPYGEYGEYGGSAERGGMPQRGEEAVRGAVGTVQETAHAAAETTRRTAEGNPLAAGMLAFGAGWLVSSLLPVSEAERRAATAAKDVAREHADVVQPLVEQAKEGAQQVGEQVKESAAEGTAEVREHAREAAGTVKEEGRGGARSLAEEARSAGQDVAGRPRPSGRRPGPEGPPGR